jgi:hypothetical protein
MQPGAFLHSVRSALPDLDAELAGILDCMEECLGANAPAANLAAALGQKRGVSGYVYHTVPVALYTWLQVPGDFRRSVTEVIALGGDTDTTGAITGALVGATAGASAIPTDWLAGLREWPRSVRWMTALAERLAEQFPDQGSGTSPGPLPLFWPGLLPRNLLFLVLVLGHVVRRCLPPY